MKNKLVQISFILKHSKNINMAIVMKKRKSKSQKRLQKQRKRQMTTKVRRLVQESSLWKKYEQEAMDYHCSMVKKYGYPMWTGPSENNKKKAIAKAKQPVLPVFYTGCRCPGKCFCMYLSCL